MKRKNLALDRLNRIAKADKTLLSNWREGLSICRDSGVSLEDLVPDVASARWVLASHHSRDANRLLAVRSPAYRSAISRFYYAMYQAMRAVAFVFHNGDDYQSHSKLHQNVPSDLPDADKWANVLKNARLARNAADYDPYPPSARAWARQANLIKTDADALLQHTRQYLRA